MAVIGQQISHAEQTPETLGMDVSFSSSFPLTIARFIVETAEQAYTRGENSPE